MKKTASVSMVAILTVMLILYIQASNPVLEQGQESSLNTEDDTGEENDICNVENEAAFRTSAGVEEGNAGKMEGTEDFCALSEEERKILLAYAEYIPQCCEEISRSTDQMKFDLVYIDGDDIPELAIIVSDADSTDAVGIYVYHDGGVRLAGFVGSYGKCRYKPYANLIFGNDVYEEQQRERLCFYRLLQADMVEQQCFFHRSQYQEQKYIGDIYFLDNRRVSEEEYNEAWARWDVDELDSWGYDDAVFVKDFDDLYGEMCRRHSEALARGGAERHSTDVTIGWRRQCLEFSRDTETMFPDDLKDVDGLIIRIHGCAPDLSFLEDMNRLTELNVSFGEEADLSYFACLDGLKRLSLYSWYGDKVDLSFLKELDQLTEIYMDRICDIEDLSFFQHMVHLKSLNLSYVSDVDLNFLVKLTDLENLEITGGNIRNPEGLAGLTQLESLYLCENCLIYDKDRPVFDLSPLENLSKLERMSLLFISIDDLCPLSGLRELCSIWLADTGVEDISALKDMENLNDLTIHGNTSGRVKKQADTYFGDLEYMIVTEEWPPGM